MKQVGDVVLFWLVCWPGEGGWSCLLGTYGQGDRRCMGGWGDGGGICGCWNSRAMVVLRLGTVMGQSRVGYRALGDGCVWGG